MALLHLDRGHGQPFGMMAPAAEGHSSRDPPTALGTGRRGRGIERAGYRRRAVAEQLAYSLQGQPGRKAGDGLVHSQVPGGRSVDAREFLPDLHACDGVQLHAAVRFRREHGEETGAMQGVVDLARKPPIRLSAGGVLLNDGAEAFDGVQEVLRRITRWHGILPWLHILSEVSKSARSHPEPAD
jgi:hypothetical protein